MKNDEYMFLFTEREQLKASLAAMRNPESTDCFTLRQRLAVIERKLAAHHQKQAKKYPRITPEQLDRIAAVREQFRRSAEEIDRLWVELNIDDSEVES